jgi:hypothetical protein
MLPIQTSICNLEMTSHVTACLAKERKKLHRSQVECFHFQLAAILMRCKPALRDWTNLKPDWPLLEKAKYKNALKTQEQGQENKCCVVKAKKKIIVGFRSPDRP